MRSGHPDREHGSPWRLRWLVAIVAIMAALTVGWPLASRAVSGSRAAVAGQPLTIGPNASLSATVTPGPNWVIDAGQSDQGQDWSLSDGPVHLAVVYVTLLSPGQAGRLWSGLLATLRLGDGSAREGAPAPVLSAAGEQGQTGTVTGNGWAGQAAVFPSPGKDFAIELVGVDRDGDRAPAVAATAQLARTLRFPWGSQ